MKKVLAASLVIILISAAAFLFFNRSKTEDAFLTAPVAKVGSETLYFQDVFEIAKREKFSALSEIELEKYQNIESLQNDNNRKLNLINLYLSKASDESMLLQEGGNKKIINLSGKVFNSNEKDYLERRNLAYKVASEISSRELERFNLQIVAIYFNKEEDESVAKSLIDAYYKEIASGVSSFKDVGERLKKDKKVLNLSERNQSSYRQLFNLPRDQKLVADEEVNSLIYKSKVGELSSVTLLNPNLRNYKTYELGKTKVGYTFYVVDDHIEGEDMNYSQWLESLRAKYKVQVL